MDPNELVAIYKAGGWVPLTAWLGHTLVRLMKSDTKLPIDVPSRLRPYVAIAITVALAIVQHRFAGTGGTWGQAVVFGVGAGVMAILAHHGIVDKLRDGREIPVPGLMKDDKPKPPSVPPLPLLLMTLAIAALSAGCAVSFEESRGLSSVRVADAAVATPLDRSACIKLDNSRQMHDALSKGSFAIALGTAGFPGVIQAVKDEGASKELVVGTVIGAAVVAGAGVFFHVRAEGKAATYMRECAS